mmetsp:Transcript_24222/g.72765  ORF Transcript_24222/g.72765 Transcript_24222/m.72765 type:complete len:418 (+) Transcript_24222:214-1467(+)
MVLFAPVARARGFGRLYGSILEQLGDHVGRSPDAPVDPPRRVGVWQDRPGGGRVVGLRLRVVHRHGACEGPSHRAHRPLRPPFRVEHAGGLCLQHRHHHGRVLRGGRGAEPGRAPRCVAGRRGGELRPRGHRDALGARRPLHLERGADGGLVGLLGVSGLGLALRQHRRGRGRLAGGDLRAVLLDRRRAPRRRQSPRPPLDVAAGGPRRGARLDDGQGHGLGLAGGRGARRVASGGSRLRPLPALRQGGRLPRDHHPRGAHRCHRHHSGPADGRERRRQLQPSLVHVRRWLRDRHRQLVRLPVGHDRLHRALGVQGHGGQNRVQHPLRRRLPHRLQLGLGGHDPRDLPLGGAQPDHLVCGSVRLHRRLGDHAIPALGRATRRLGARLLQLGLRGGSLVGGAHLRTRLHERRQRSHRG